MRIGHQFPGGTLDDGDFRDRLVRRFARAVEARTEGGLRCAVFPDAALVREGAQFSALRHDVLDAAVLPIVDAGDDIPEAGIGLMPCLLTTHARTAAFQASSAGRQLSALLDKRGVRILTWIWLAGGIAARDQPVAAPADARDRRLRGGSRAMAAMFRAAGARRIDGMPSTRLRDALANAKLDAAATSATSLISFRIHEVARHLAAPGETSFWFLLSPLVISRAVFDDLSAPQRDAVVEAGTTLDAFARTESEADTARVAGVFEAAGVRVTRQDTASVDAWRPFAEAAWKDYADRGEGCASLLRLAREGG